MEVSSLPSKFAAIMGIALCGLAPSQCRAQVVSNSVFEIVSNVSDVRLVSKPGSTKSTRILFWRSKREDPPQQARAQIGVVEILPGSVVTGASFRIQSNVRGIDCEGCDFVASKVTIGSR